MQDQIVNRVANSKLVVFDLEDYYPKGKRVIIDIKDWLFEGLVLREKEFRVKVEEHDWSQYLDSYVALTCTSDAIVPSWAYMLMTINLESFAKQVFNGNLEQLETSLYQTIIENLDVAPYKDKSLIIKGCSHKPVPINAYLFLAKRLKPIARSIMFGEACSAVPLFKKK